jgi:hypothetical protein
LESDYKTAKHLLEQVGMKAFAKISGAGKSRASGLG